jgi:hypothetical protein
VKHTKKVLLSATWEFIVPEDFPNSVEPAEMIGEMMRSNPVAFLATRMTDPDNKNNWQPKTITSTLHVKHDRHGKCCEDAIVKHFEKVAVVDETSDNTMQTGTYNYGNDKKVVTE